MKSFFLFLFAVSVLLSCQSKSDKPGEDKQGKSNNKAAYTISKDGIEEIKIGMKQAELEKITGQQFKFKTDNESQGYWIDTIRIQYKDMPVALFFERIGTDGVDSYMQLAGIETTSDLCKTATGISMGDDKFTVLKAYDDYSITMGPDYEPVNDTTWVPSKTKYSIYVSDSSYERQINFRMTNRKVTAIGASYAAEH